MNMLPDSNVRKDIEACPVVVEPYSSDNIRLAHDVPLTECGRRLSIPVGMDRGSAAAGAG